ncbi:MAG TPA: hypothetical protein VFS83_15360 [Ktedonobacterales bacterium]|nr:hypothetical protein [Ktedonobacterales bacterium]
MVTLPSVRRLVAVLTCLLSVPLILGGCATATPPAGSGQQGQTTTAVSAPPTSYHPSKTVTYGASWATLYHDLKSLKQSADLGVAGTISRVSTVSTDEGGIVYTDFVFTVKTTLLDPKHRLNNQSLLIHQTGGMVGSTLYQMEDDPLFEIGEQAILFLHEYSPGHYFVIGGPSGRFRVQNGLVSPINTEGVTLGTPLTEAAFTSKVQQA